MVRYTVSAVAADDATFDELLTWLSSGHVAAVCRAAGASAEVVVLDGGTPRIVEVRYAFPSRAALESYERDHAPALRAEGIARFGATVRMERTTGAVVARFAASAR